MESPVSTEPSPGKTPLVSLTFEKDPDRKRKFLEADPKILGVAQIMLSLFNIGMSTIGCLTVQHNCKVELASIFVSLCTIAAGSISISAQDLHLPKLKACLALQIIGGALLVVVWPLHLGTINVVYSYKLCWTESNMTEARTTLCDSFQAVYGRISAEGELVQVALIAVCMTLAVYSGKAIQCCGQGSRMPVITVNSPPPPSQSSEEVWQEAGQ
ncbi:uncharacterized protein [Lepisosteus oculatus]|nr:PREDICTED: uncharacterized protein LOC107076581 [Lepisosteus oculatus]XP_015196057.1 PREDICTED: uncharacterized protein LOC107076581 [Lepisosteus oculatus]XP_015196058.1 PREDICTED: uncharacterized protein LOC107076581 [Lepisosteus oculatus]XP_015196059.1 PREDICTED: uncharacterized protein LOC107076581 [Lepisosteus oculatus]